MENFFPNFSLFMPISVYWLFVSAAFWPHLLLYFKIIIRKA